MSSLLRSLRAPLAVVLMLVLTMAGCGLREEDSTNRVQPQGSNLRIILGTQQFPEARLLGELWRQALSANGYVVELRKDAGQTEQLTELLARGDIDGYVAYTGTSLSIVAGEDVSGLDPQKTYDQVQAYYQKHGMTLSGMTRFQNKDAIATTTSYADKHGLRTLEDLAKLGRFRLGARPEFGNLDLGMKGLRDTYGIDRAKFVPTKLGTVYTALDDGKIQAGNVFTTDPDLRSGRYQVLEDTKLLFGSQNAAMTVSTTKLDKVGRTTFLRVVDTVNDRLTESVMIDLNEAVVEGRDEVQVASAFLRDQGLLRPLDSEN